MQKESDTELKHIPNLIRNNIVYHLNKKIGEISPEMLRMIHELYPNDLKSVKTKKGNEWYFVGRENFYIPYFNDTDAESDGICAIYFCNTARTLFLAKLNKNRIEEEKKQDLAFLMKLALTLSSDILEQNGLWSWPPKCLINERADSYRIRHLPEGAKHIYYGNDAELQISREHHLINNEKRKATMFKEFQKAGISMSKEYFLLIYEMIMTVERNNKYSLMNNLREFLKSHQEPDISLERIVNVWSI